MTVLRSSLPALLAALLVLAGCADREPAGPPPVRKTPITAVEARTAPVRVVQEAIGQLESKTSPVISAEVAGQVVEILADRGQTVKAGQPLARLDDTDFRLQLHAAQAEVKRLQALVQNQQRQVERYRDIVKQNFITQSTLDEAEGQLEALREQLSAAGAGAQTAQRNLQRTRITSPVNARVEQRLIAQGNFVGVGDALFRITTGELLQAVLPFPETVAGELRTGLAVELSTPADPDNAVLGTITEISPMVDSTSRAINVIVELTNPGGWRPGASVTGRVIMAERAQAVMVPEQSVVRRPAGTVVYVLNGETGETVQARMVRLGVRHTGWIEVLSGVDAGERVAVDGAAFLTDEAPVSVQEART